MQSLPVMGSPQIVRVILYVRNIPRVADFYQRFFGLRPLRGATDGWLELASAAGGCTIALHQAAISQKSGASMKLVFGVADVRDFKRATEKQGLKLGLVHAVTEEGQSFEFANAKDSAGNSISISSRGFTE